MICASVEEFLAALPPKRAIAGLDLGDKTIGVALSDLRRQVATPIEGENRNTHYGWYFDNIVGLDICCVMDRYIKRILLDRTFGAYRLWPNRSCG